MHRVQLIIASTILAILLSAGAQAQTWLTNGLVAYYPFNGNADDTAGVNSGYVYNAISTTNRFGNPNSAYFFNGTSSYISVPNNAVLSSFSNSITVSCWVLYKDPPFPEHRCLIGKFAASTFTPENGFLLRLSDSAGPSMGLLYADFGGTWLAANYQADFSARQGQWFHVAVVASNLLTHLYVDGIQVAQSTNMGVFNNSDPLTIGGQNGTFLNRLHCGSLDDIRIYKRALSSNEVAALYWYESVRTVDIVKAYTLDFRNLTLGASYQLQASTNLLSWTNWGNPFTATTDRYTNTIPYQRVEDWTKLFFRLQQQ